MSSIIRSSFILLSGILVLFSGDLIAQENIPAVEKSNQKIIYKGDIYYIHKVAKGNTLYSICKTYHVSQEDLRKANPSAELDPLSIGQALRIPARENDSDIPVYYDEDENFIYHEVQAGETLFFIHRKYRVPLKAIYKYNPGSEESISIGQIIKIPKDHLLSESDPAKTDMQEESIHYTVQQGDTLYRIAKDYGISVSALILANEKLRWGLKTGDVIIIPVKSGYDDLAYQMTLDSMLLVADLTKLSARQCDSVLTSDRMRTAIKVALVLPFFADKKFSDEFNAERDTLPSGEIRKKPKTFKGRVAIEFYEGLLLAVDSLKNHDIDINLFVYDTEADTNKVKMILDDLEIIQPDLILGPFLPANIALMNKFSTENMIPFVPPLMRDDSTLKHNPNLFQVIPSRRSELEIWSDYLSQHAYDNVVFVYKKKLFKEAEIDQYKRILIDRMSKKIGVDTLLFTEILIDDSLQSNLDKYLLDSLENVVIVASSYEPEVSDVLTKLHFILQTKQIKVFGMPAWQKFKSIRIEHFHDMNVTIYTPFFIDYSDPLVKSFVLKCRKVLNYEPFMTTSKGTGINYTFLGYDLGSYFISAMKRYGKSTCDCIPYYQPDLLLSSFAFKRNRVYGYNENTSISIVTYRKDISIERIKIDQIEY